MAKALPSKRSKESTLSYLKVDSFDRFDGSAFAIAIGLGQTSYHDCMAHIPTLLAHADANSRSASSNLSNGGRINGSFLRKYRYEPAEELSIEGCAPRQFGRF